MTSSPVISFTQRSFTIPPRCYYTVSTPVRYSPCALPLCRIWLCPPDDIAPFCGFSGIVAWREAMCTQLPNMANSICTNDDGSISTGVVEWTPGIEFEHGVFPYSDHASWPPVVMTTNGRWIMPCTLSGCHDHVFRLPGDTTASSLQLTCKCEYCANTGDSHLCDKCDDVHCSGCAEFAHTRDRKAVVTWNPVVVM